MSDIFERPQPFMFWLSQGVLVIAVVGVGETFQVLVVLDEL
jgi:hypothetical protein